MLLLVRFSHPAGVMELADVPDSKSGGSDTVRVRPPPPAPSMLDKKDIMPANGLTEPLAGIYLAQNQKCTSVDIF